MRRTLVALVLLVTLAALAAPTVAAKEEFWIRICGENGCKLIKDRLVAAALSSEAEEFGTKVRASVHLPLYRVRYVAPDSEQPTGPTYWLAAQSIKFTIGSSQRSVSNLFVRAIGGVSPFAPTNNHSNHWEWFAVGSGAGAAVLASSLPRIRRNRNGPLARSVHWIRL